MKNLVFATQLRIFVFDAVQAVRTGSDDFFNLVIIQSLVLIIKNIVHSNIIFLPLMYIFPFLILITCIVILNDSNKYYRILPFTNKVNQ